MSGRYLVSAKQIVMLLQQVEDEAQIELLTDILEKQYVMESEQTLKEDITKLRAQEKK